MKTYLSYIRHWTGMALLGLVTTAWGQSSIPDPQWTKTYPGYGTIYTSNRNQLGMSTNGTILHNGIKFSIAGDTLLRFGGPYGTTVDGGFITYFFSITYLPPLDPRRFFARWGFQKQDAAGNVMFVRELHAGYGPEGSTSMDFGGIKKILGTPDNGFIVLGEQGEVTRYDAGGVERWSKTLTHPASTIYGNLIRTESVINTPEGGYLIMGYIPGVVGDPFNRESPSAGWVAKLDTDGRVQWEKRLGNLSAGLQNLVHSTYAITDACPAADGNGYALVGSGYGFSSPVQAPTSAVLLELAPDGSLKRGRAYPTLDPTPAFVTRYRDGRGETVYVLGNTAIGAPNFDYRLVKINTAPVSPLASLANLLSIVAQRSFSLSDTFLERLTDVEVAADGGLVLAGTTGLIKLFSETKTDASLVLDTPIYNCDTGFITFRVSGGDGSPITYTAPGIIRTSISDNTGVVESELRHDPKPILIEAFQTNHRASLLFDFGAYCRQPPPPVGEQLRLVAPAYDCATGAIHFMTTGGDGSLIEYAAAGITGWTANPNQFVDVESRTVADVQPFTLMARQRGQVVSYVWNLKAACGRARLGVAEAGLTVNVLGNPVQASVHVLVSGVQGQPVELRLTDMQGRLLDCQLIEQAGLVEEYQFVLSSGGAAMLLFQARSNHQERTVRVIRP